MRAITLGLFLLLSGGCYVYTLQELQEIDECQDSGGVYRGTAVLEECDHGDQAP